MTLSPTPEIVADLKAGRMVILVDEEDRENEGDVVIAADFVTPDAINFMARHARGLVCLTLEEDRCRRLGLSPMVAANRSGMGTNFTASIEAAEGVTGVMPHVPFGTDVPGMRAIVDYHKQNHPNDTHDALYVRGWTYVSLWSEALRRADKAGELNGEGVKKATETLLNYDLGGLTGNVTYTATDHRPSTKVNIFIIKDGKLAITKTPNGENPLVTGGWPLLGVDVWEHSYYIDYRNERPKYLEAWFDNLINWAHVEEMFALAPK